MARVTGPHVHVATIGSFANSADTGHEFIVFYNLTGQMIEITKAYVAVTATAHSTTFWNIRLRDHTGGAIVTKTLASGTYVASSPITMGTPDTTYSFIDDDEQVYVRVDHEATGVAGQAMESLAVILEYNFINEP